MFCKKFKWHNIMNSSGNNYDNLLASLRGEFVEEAEDNLTSIEMLLENLRAGQEGGASAIDNIRRYAHSLKGSAGVADFPVVSMIMHRMEDYLSGAKELSEKQIDDVQVFIDRARDFSSLDIEQNKTASSELVRQLPNRHSKDSLDEMEGDAEQRVIEALMVTREKAAGQIFERELKEEGLRVTTVRSSFEAIEMAVRAKPNIIICSGVIDELSGVDLSCAIKSIPVTKDIPVCLLTSFEKGHHELEGLRDDVYLIQKSNLKEDLKNILEKYNLSS